MNAYHYQTSIWTINKCDLFGGDLVGKKQNSHTHRICRQNCGLILSSDISYYKCAGENKRGNLRSDLQERLTHKKAT